MTSRFAFWSYLNYDLIRTEQPKQRFISSHEFRNREYASRWYEGDSTTQSYAMPSMLTQDDGMLLRSNLESTWSNTM